MTCKISDNLYVRNHSSDSWVSSYVRPIHNYGISVTASFTDSWITISATESDDVLLARWSCQCVSADERAF